jgi:hypothetical protein
MEDRSFFCSETGGSVRGRCLDREVVPKSGWVQEGGDCANGCASDR